jgi:hypothetical protein
MSCLSPSVLQAHCWPPFCSSNTSELTSAQLASHAQGTQAQAQGRPSAAVPCALVSNKREQQLLSSSAYRRVTTGGLRRRGRLEQHEPCRRSVIFLRNLLHSLPLFSDLIEVLFCTSLLMHFLQFGEGQSYCKKSTDFIIVKYKLFVWRAIFQFVYQASYNSS